MYLFPLNPEEFNFSAGKYCTKQSNVFDQSMTTILAMLFVSRCFMYLQINSKKKLFELESLMDLAEKIESILPAKLNKCFLNIFHGLLIANHLKV